MKEKKPKFEIVNGEKVVKMTCSTFQGNEKKVWQEIVTPRDNLWSLSLLCSCINSCEGSAKRTLEDLSQFNEKELLTALKNGYYTAGEQYSNIIALGKLLESLILKIDHSEFIDV